MDPSLRIAASGMTAQNHRVQAISHNIANVNTTAFKKSRAQFEDLMYQTVQGSRYVSLPGSEVTDPVQLGRGVRLVSNSKMFTQGPVEQTGRALDFAIEGRGFFQVELPDGQMAYTRDGSFSLNADSGLLTTRAGYAVAPGIAIPENATEVTVSPNGIVSVVTEGSTESVEVGRMELVRFMNPEGLLAAGENLYLQSDASGEPIVGMPQEDGFGRISQGALESSNVEIVQEMVDMITAMRAYEQASRAVQTADQMMEQANALVR